MTDTPSIDLSGLPTPAHRDPTGDQAIRNILAGIDWSPHADWRLFGPDGGAGTPVTLLLAPDVAQAFFAFLLRNSETRKTRSGNNYRVRLKKKAPGAPVVGATGREPYTDSPNPMEKPNV